MPGVSQHTPASSALNWPGSQHAEAPGPLVFPGGQAVHPTAVAVQPGGLYWPAGQLAQMLQWAKGVGRTVGGRCQLCRGSRGSKGLVGAGRGVRSGAARLGFARREL